MADSVVNGGVRNLRDPASKQQPALFEGPDWKSFSSAECQSVDCFHHNATVVGHMFFLLSQGGVGGPENGVSVPGIGLDRAFAIVAEAERSYWRRETDDLEKARAAMLAAAQAVDGSAVSAVDLAWRAVNVSGRDARPTPRPTPTPGRCPGDCNRDGSVTIDEVITVVNLLLDFDPNIAICPLGDANQDGQINVSDGVAAVGASLHGCGVVTVASGAVASQVGRPRIELDSNFARPGEVVALDLVLQGSGPDTVAFEADLVVPHGLTLSSCRAADRLSHEVTGVRFPPAETGDANGGMRVIGIDLGNNTAPLGDGPLATCTLKVSDNAPFGPAPIALTRVGVSNSQGVLTVPASRGGTVTVTACSQFPLLCAVEIADPRDSLKISAGRKVDWRWQTTGAFDLSNPDWQSFRFCVYDGSRLALAFDAPAGSVWHALRPTFLRYENRPLGVRKLELRQTASGETRVRAAGTGDPLSIPALPLGQTAGVLAELQTDTRCWLAVYAQPAIVNDERRFYDANVR